MRIHTLGIQSTLTPIVSLISRETQIFQDKIEDFSHYINFDFGDSDICLVPHNFDLWNKEYSDYVLEISKLKPVIYFNLGDRPKCKSISNSFSIHNVPCCQNCVRQIITPYNVQSLSFLPLREKKQRPELSFVGYVPSLTPRRVLRAFEQNPLRPWLAESSIIRKANLRYMRKHYPHARIQKRKHYGGARSLINNPSEFRNEYVDAIKSSDFVLCPRGDANSSQRFFEVLSSGRIPLVPNTNVEFPRMNGNDYSASYIEIMPFGKDVKKRIEEFWNCLDNQVYLSLQIRNREIFQKYFSYNSFYRNMFKTAYSSLESQYCRSSRL